jgi:adenylyltransferase/sulfurtransferase
MAILTDSQLLRYARNILLSDIDVAGQERLLRSHVVVIGAGGLGSPVLQYCAAAGIGQLTIIDDDRVDETNLQRQVLFNEQQIDQPKAEAAAEQLQKLNSDVSVCVRFERLTSANVDHLLHGADLVIAGTDNIGSRMLANRFCRTEQIPLVSGAAIGTSGQVTSFDFRYADRACLGCVYPGEGENLSCAESGVLGPVVGVIGSLMATEAIKLLLNIGKPLTERLLLWDAMTMEWQTFNYAKSPTCKICGDN